jgi:hypothetical protein
MADPNATIDVHTEVLIIEGGGGVPADFNSPLFVAEFADIGIGRIKAYVGTLDQMTTELANDGFAASHPIRKMVAKAKAQNRPPNIIHVGRRDPGDADWAAAFDAIQAESELEAANWFYVAVNVRDMGEIGEIAAWCAPRFLIYIAVTKDIAVYNGVPGNLAAAISALNYPNIALIWHDAATATSFGPASIRSRAGDFSVANGDTLSWRFDGGTIQTATIEAEAAVHTSTNAGPFDITPELVEDPDVPGSWSAPIVMTVDAGFEQETELEGSVAIVTNTVAGPFEFSGGEQLQYRRNGAAPLSVTFPAEAGVLEIGEVGPFDFADGWILAIEVDLAAEYQLEVEGAAAFLTTDAETYNLVAGQKIEFSFDGNPALSYTVAAIDFGGTPNVATAAQLQAALQTAYAAEGVVTVEGGNTVKVASLTVGSGSSVTVALTSSAAAIAELGLALGQTNAGSGTFPDIDDVSAAELVDWLNTLPGATTVLNGDDTSTMTSETKGSDSKIEITNASTPDMLTALGLAVGNNAGSGFAGDAAQASAAEVAIVLGAAANTTAAANDDETVSWNSDTIGTGSRMQVVGGTANLILGFTTNEAAGTGDFVDATVVEPAEIRTKMVQTFSTVTIAVTELDELEITTRSMGSLSSIDVTEAPAAIGLVGSATGDGNVGNAAQANAPELAGLFGTGIIEGTSTAVSNRVVLAGLLSGDEGSIELLDGTLIVKLGFEATSASGIGVDEDYIDCACIGFNGSKNLDAPGSHTTWNKTRFTGITGDKLPPSVMASFKTRNINFYMRQGTKQEFHWGVLLRDVKRYIDEQVTAQYLDARVTEAWDNALARAASRKSAIVYGQPGIDKLTAEAVNVFDRADKAAAIVYDASPLDLEDEASTGIYKPTVGGQTAGDIDDRVMSGWVFRFEFLPDIHEARSLIELRRPFPTAA